MKWLRFILSHSIFISFCAVALCYQTYTILHLQGDNMLYLFIFFATLSSYNFYWMTGKFHFQNLKGIPAFILKEASHLIVFTIAGIVMLICTWHLIYLLPYIIIACIFTILYSMPLWNRRALSIARKAGFLKTVLLSLTWAYVTVIFPGHQSLFNENYKMLLLLFIARFSFMLMLCLIFDMRDMAMDKLNALHSLATDVSRKWLLVIMASAFVIYMLAGAWVRWLNADNNQLIAHTITGIIVWFVYRLSLKKQGYVFYYFVVDGLMFVSALATFVAAKL